MDVIYDRLERPSADTCWNDSLRYLQAANEGLLAHDVGGEGVNLTELIIVQLWGGLVDTITERA